MCKDSIILREQSAENVVKPRCLHLLSTLRVAPTLLISIAMWAHGVDLHTHSGTLSYNKIIKMAAMAAILNIEWPLNFLNLGQCIKNSGNNPVKITCLVTNLWQQEQLIISTIMTVFVIFNIDHNYC